MRALKYETWNPADEFADRDEYIGALADMLMTLGGPRIKAIFRSMMRNRLGIPHSTGWSSATLVLSLAFLATTIFAKETCDAFG